MLLGYTATDLAGCALLGLRESIALSEHLVFVIFMYPKSTADGNAFVGAERRCARQGDGARSGIVRDRYISASGGR
jgi:hypothetical protein